MCGYSCVGDFMVCVSALELPQAPLVSHCLYPSLHLSLSQTYIAYMKCVRSYIHVCMYIYTCTCTYTYIYTHIFMHVHAHIHTYIHIYTYTYVYSSVHISGRRGTNVYSYKCHVYSYTYHVYLSTIGV